MISVVVLAFAIVCVCYGTPVPGMNSEPFESNNTFPYYEIPTPTTANNMTFSKSTDMTSIFMVGNGLLVVGAPGDGGAVYPYTFDPTNQTWTQSQSAFTAASFQPPLNPGPSPAPETVENYGRVVTLDGDWLGVGATSEGFGIVLMYNADYDEANYFSETWQILTSPHGTNATEFGKSMVVSATGKWLAIQSVAKVDSNSESATVIMYRYPNGSDPWTYNHTLTAPNADNSFGSSMSFNGNGDVLAIGSPVSKKVYVYKEDYPTKTFELQATLTEAAAAFGSDISMANDGSWLAVSAPSAPQAEGATGEVFLYNYESGTYNRKQIITSGTSKFGHSLSLSGDGTSLIVGGYLHNQGAQYPWAAKAFVYNLSKGIFVLAGALNNAMNPTPSLPNQIHDFQVLMSDDGSLAPFGVTGCDSYHSNYTGVVDVLENVRSQ